MKPSEMFKAFMLVMLASVATVPPAIAATAGVTRQIPLWVQPPRKPAATCHSRIGRRHSRWNSPASSTSQTALVRTRDPIVNRSLSKGSGKGASATSGPKAKSNPALVRGFEGLNLYQQRYARGGNQFTVEPPDQGLCVGNGYVLEAVNDVLNVYNTTGLSALPDNTATNIVCGFPRERQPRCRSELVLRLCARDQPHDRCRGPDSTDPVLLRRGDAALFRCRADARYASNGALYDCEPPRHGGQPDVGSDRRTGTSTRSMSPTTARTPAASIPARTWATTRTSARTANGFYLTTNAYPWCATASPVRRSMPCRSRNWRPARQRDLVHLDTSGMVNAAERRRLDAAGLHRVACAVARHRQFNTANGGTESS